MTKQAKIAQQIKRYIRQVADADYDVVNTREWKDYASVINDTRMKLKKELDDVLKQLNNHIYPSPSTGISKNYSSTEKRKIQSVINSLMDAADAVKLYADSGSWNKYYLKEAQQYNVKELGQLASKIKGNPLAAVNNNYRVTLKKSKDFLRSLK